ncbi:MAG: twin-arginine translocation signal domain-containing protein [Bryobacteraceae bacterium]
MADQTSDRRDFLKSAGAAAFTTSLFTGNVRGQTTGSARALSVWARWAARICPTR